MEQKLVRVPFDIELAKEISNGSKEGRIVTRDGENARLICMDRKTVNKDHIIALVEYFKSEEPYIYDETGRRHKHEDNLLDLFLEIPEYMTFKDGDVIAFDGKEAMFVLRKNEGYSDSHSFPPYYVGIDEFGFVIFGKEGAYCRADRGRLATEEEKVQFAEKLKVNKDPRVKEYLEKYFGIKDSPEVSNSAKIGKKEELAQAYTDKEVRRYHKHSGVIEKYGMERARMTSEHESWELKEAFEAGWDACMEYLANIPWDEAMNEIVNFIKSKDDDHGRGGRTSPTDEG